MLEFEVREGEFADHRLAVLDLPAGEVDADEAALRVGEGHGDEVSAGGASEFEDAAGLRGGGVEAEDSTEDGEAVGIGLGEGADVIGDGIIGGGGGGLRFGAHRRLVITSACESVNGGKGGGEERSCCGAFMGGLRWGEGGTG